MSTHGDDGGSDDGSPSAVGEVAAALDYRIRPAAVFHPLTPFYDLGCEILGLGAGFKRWALDLAAVAPGHRVLDVACGTGVLAAEAAARGARTTAVDPDPGALHVAVRRAARGSLAIGFVRGRAEQLPFPDGAFDRVVCSLAFHHVPDAAKDLALREMARVVRPEGGRLLLLDFDNHRRWWVPGHFRSARRLPEWLDRAGLDARLRWRGRLLYAFEAIPRGSAADP